MNGYLIYSFKEVKDKKSVSYTVVFCPIEIRSIDFLIETTREYFKFNNPTDYIALVFPSFHNEIFSNFDINYEVVYKRLIDFSYDKTLFLISYDSKGECFDLSKGKKAAPYFLKYFRQEGLYSIFMNGDGMLESDDTFHYILPSGKHSKLFMRVGNVLSTACEVTFVAFSLLPHFKNEFEYIYCDSSSISSVAYVLSLIKLKFSQFENWNYKLPIIQSFGAYENLKEYRFNLQSLVLISASSTGGLKKKLIALHKLVNEYVVTLYYLGDSDRDITILINLLDFPFRDRINNDYDFSMSPNEIDCKFCNKNSFPVKLMGEHFIPAKPLIEQIKIVKKSRPTWLNDFMEQFYGRNVIKCNYGNDKDKIREFYLDLNAVHSDMKVDFNHKEQKENHKKKSSYETHFYKFLENSLPISVEYIIWLPDKASEKMANQIKDYFQQQGKQKLPEIIPFHMVAEFHEKNKSECKGTILVAASSVATGKKLYKLSLLFRDFHNCSVYYLFGISRTPNDDLLKTLKSDLEFRQDIINANNCWMLEKIYIPDRHNDFGKELENSPWVKEQKFINELLEPYFIDNNIELSVLKSRQRIIKSASETEGIVEGLFWPKFKDDLENLKLRKSFAFFDFDYDFQPSGLKPSQADVYFTISAILHNLRFKTSDGNKFLEQHEYKRSVIAPQMFNRYSDGVIQACLLRAAYPKEVNYSVDFNLSYDAKKNLISIFDDESSDNAEALYEFLYAIAIGKLKLTQRDLLDFISFIEVKYSAHETVQGLVKFIKAN